MSNGSKKFVFVPFCLLAQAYQAQEINSMNLPKYVLHDDLHHNNILKSKNDWKVIDTHGVVGEKNF